MPKPNKTMLDKLVDVFQEGSKRKPEIIQQTAWRDPLGYTMEQRRYFERHPDRHQKLDMTPQREVYQKGIDEVRRANIRSLKEQSRGLNDDLEELQDDFNSAWDEAREDLISDIDGTYAPELERQFDPDYYMTLDMPSGDIRDYWPSSTYTPDEFAAQANRIYDDMDVLDDKMDYMRTPEYRMELQHQSPRYRRYQEAMQGRDINRRAGRVNAAIMNLARQGYSLPEIREILRRQGR